MLALNLHRLEHKQALLWYQEMAFWLTLWKSSDEYAFLRDCHSQVLQQSMMQSGIEPLRTASTSLRQGTTEQTDAAI